MTSEMVQSVVEIMDSAHQHRYELEEVITGIGTLEKQINSTSDAAISSLDTHFSQLKEAVNQSIDKRLAQLKAEVESIRGESLKPLEECKTLVKDKIASTAQVMNEGASLLSDDPEQNVENILKFKESPTTKALSSIPAIPGLAEVACVNVVLSPDLSKRMQTVVGAEGRVLGQVPVQIAEIVEKPGSLTVHWTETEEDSDISEFWLQYALGNHTSTQESNVVYHTAYVGTLTSYTVKHLRVSTPYTFRVCGRGETDTPWSAWSILRVAGTKIDHYKWSESENKAYSLGNECKVATRTSQGLTHVLYSDIPSYTVGNTLTIKVLDEADKSPGDGLCISLNNSPTDAFGKEGVVYVNLYGAVSVDGQEMSMQLPEIRKGSVVAFQTEQLPNGKVRVSVQHEEKEVTFDWKVEDTRSKPDLNLLSMMSGQQPEPQALDLFFGIKFSQEDWKISVE